ncbi:MAG: hypothetical protein ABI697_00335 [Devosia sp.]
MAPMWGYTTIDRKTFALGILLRIGLFVAATLAFPFLLQGSVGSSNCSSVQGACGAVALLFAAAFKPLIFLAFLLSLPNLLARRLRHIGISPWWAAFVLLLIVADNQVLIYTGAPWSFAFSSGVLGLSRPDYLFEALALLIVMAILPGRDGRISVRILGWPAIAAIVLAAFISLEALLRLLVSLPSLMLLLQPLLRVVHLIALPALLAMIALPPTALAVLWPRRGQTNDTSEPARPAHPLPLSRIGIVAAVVTVIAVFIASPEMRSMPLMPVWIVPIGLPTFAAYGLLVLTIYLLRKRYGLVAYAALALTLVVFGSWAWGFVAEHQVRTEDERTLAAITTAPRPASLPNALLLETANNQPASTLLARGDIAMVIEKHGATLVALTRSPSGHYPVRTPLAVMPERYLYLRTSRDSSFADKRTRYEFETPFELRLVGPGQDDLLGVFYRREVHPPRIPPVLNLNGGWSVQQTVLHTQVSDLLKTFLDRTLGVAPPPPPIAAAPAVAMPAKPKRQSLFDVLFGPKSSTPQLEQAPAPN